MNAHVIVVLVVVLIIYLFARFNTSAYDDYLTGYWVGDPDFCEDADIDSMLVWIGPPTSGWFSQTRDCYIVMTPDRTNQPFTMSHSKGWASPFTNKYCVKAKVELEDDKFMPEDVEFDLDVHRGLLRIRDSETVYAKLYKQTYISDVLKIGPGEVEADSAEIPE